jgi:hypothetical protein
MFFFIYDEGLLAAAVAKKKYSKMFVKTTNKNNKKSIAKTHREKKTCANNWFMKILHH